MQPKPPKSVDHGVLNKLAKAMSSIKDQHAIMQKKNVHCILKVI